MKKFLYFKLKILAKLVISKYQPKIVAITGSVGKTSAKQAIFAVLDGSFRARKSYGNFNNEIGLPLTIFGKENNPGRNLFKWFLLFLVVFKNLIFRDKNYPEVLILEMGADKPGDIDYLTSIAKPNISVVTAIGPSHLEFFKTIENVSREKSRILSKLKKEDWAILNCDDPLVKQMSNALESNILTYGKDQQSQVAISDIKVSQRSNEYGTSFKIRHKGAEIPIFMPRALGWQHAQAAAAGCAVGLAMGMNLVEINKNILNYSPARGRTNLIEGIKGSLIIDDTYNASPQSAAAALETISQIPESSRKIAVFGDMLELGPISEQAHFEVGRLCAKLNLDMLIVVGERSRDLARGAKENGMSEDRIFHFPFNKEAGLFLQEKIKPGDSILVKGSRGSKMDQIVFEIMAHPDTASELLVYAVK